MKTSIQLTTDYLRTDSSLEKRILKEFVDKLQIAENDSPVFTRQFTAFKILNEGGDPIKSQFLLSAMSKVILSSHLPVEVYHKVNNKWELSPELQSLRGGFWEYLNRSYFSKKELICTILLDFLDNISYSNAVLISFDAFFVNQFILDNLKPEKFEDVIFVNSYLDSVNKKEVNPDWQEIARSRFQSETYILFKELKFKHYTEVDPYSSVRDYEVIRERKEERHVSNIGVKDLAGFKKVFPVLRELYTFPYSQQYNFNLETDLWLSGIMKYYPEDGLEILDYYLKHDNIALINPFPIYQRALDHGKNTFEKLFGIVNGTVFQCQESWKDAYFMLLPEDVCSKEKLEEGVLFYQSVKISVQWPQSMVSKFEVNFPDVLIRMLTVFTDRRKKDNTFQYKLPSGFFSRHLGLLETNFELAKIAYFDAITIEPHYDFDKSEFMLFYNRQPSFLSEYLNYQFPKRYHNSESPLIGISIIWENDNAESAIYDAVKSMAKNKLYSIYNHPESFFFEKLSNNQTSRAINLLKQMLTDNSTDRNIVNVVLDISRNVLPDYYHSLIIHQLEKNPSFEFFEKLEFYNNHFMMDPGTSWDDFKANVLTEVFETVKAYSESYKYLKHLNILEERIIQYKKNGEEDRKKYFMGLN